VLAAALYGALAGCSSTPPATELEGEVGIPADWAAAPTEHAPTTPEPPGHADPRWWRVFGDPDLDRLLDEVLAGNRDLAVAAARLDEATAQARIAGAGRAPAVGVQLDGARRRQAFIGLPIPGGDVLTSTSTSLGASLNVSWEADLWGRLRARRRGAAAAAGASASELAGAHLSLSAQAAKSWFGLIEAARQVELAERTLASRRQTRDRIDRRYRAGLGSGLDLRLAIANQASAEAALAARRRALDSLRRQLELLASRYPGAAPRPEAESRDLPQLPPPPPTGLPAELVARRPDLVALEARLAAAGFAVAEARAALYPALRLTGGSGRVSRELGDLLDNDFSVWSLVSGILQPVFQGGRLRAAVDLGEARYRQLAESWVQGVLRAFGEVESALAAEGWLAEQETALAEATRQATAAERLAEDRYHAGLVGYLAVLEAQREASAVRARHLALRRQLLDNRIDLYLALGGAVAAGEES